MQPRLKTIAAPALAIFFTTACHKPPNLPQPNTGVGFDHVTCYAPDGKIVYRTATADINPGGISTHQFTPHKQGVDIAFVAETGRQQKLQKAAGCIIIRDLRNDHGLPENIREQFDQDFRAVVSYSSKPSFDHNSLINVNVLAPASEKTLLVERVTYYAPTLSGQESVLGVTSNRCGCTIREIRIIGDQLRVLAFR